MGTTRPAPRAAARPAGGQVAGLLVLLVLAAALLGWAKWAPYLEAVRGLSSSRAWSGTSVLGRAPGSSRAPGRA